MNDLYRLDLTKWHPEERIDGVLYPSNIAWLWSADELADIGLYKPVAADPVLEGYRVTSTAAHLVDGVIKYVHELEVEPGPVVDDYKAAIVTMLDATAQSRRYDNAVSIATYVGSTIPQWAAEATAFVAWRDAVWAYAYTELDKVTAAQREQPTVADLVAELPAMVWPVSPMT